MKDNRKTDKETWRTIPGYPRYKVSSKGRVKSFTSSLFPEGKILKVHVNPQGYQMVHLTEGTERKENNSKYCFVHRLIAESFIPVPRRLCWMGRKNLQVDHIIPVSNGGGLLDENGKFNLRWVTAKENANNEMSKVNREKAVVRKSSPVYVYDEGLNLVSAFTSTAEASRQTGKSQGNISSACMGSLPRYLKRIWSYIKLDSIQQREEIEESQRHKFLANRESVNASQRRNYEKYKEAGKLYYQTHREESIQRARDYYRRNKEKVLLQNRERRLRRKMNEENGKPGQGT